MLVGVDQGTLRTIQDAIDAANDGDTVFVYNESSPYSSAIIDKAVILIGENKETTVIENGVSIVEQNNVIITGFMINRLEAYLMDNLTIINNDFNGLITGIVIGDCTNVKIINNTLMNQSDEGIFINGQNHIITGNIITLNHIGLTMFRVQHSIISNNFFISPHYDSLKKGIDLDESENNIIKNNSFVKVGIDLDSYENTFSGNIVNGKPFILLKGEANKTVDDAGQVILVHCNQITVCNLTILGVPVGIKLYGSNNCSLSNNTVSWCDIGIGLGFSDMNTLSQNTFINCSYGINLGLFSNSILAASMNTLSHNTIIDCPTGITIYYGSLNTIKRNSIQKSYTGINVQPAGVRNTVRENNFMENSCNAFFDESIHNQWQNNYWGGPRYLPYIIHGYLISNIVIFYFFFNIPWINFDWHPAQEPYNIPGMS